MIRCLVVDDEPLAGKLIEAYIDKFKDLECVKVLTNPLESLAILQTTEIDLIFLDIQMPELNGIQLAKIIGDKTKIIFTTAYPNYAVEGFELEALDYLVKPITLERFLKAVNKYRKEVEVVPAVQIVPEAESSEYIFVKTEYRHQKVKFDRILYFKGYGDYCAIYLEGEKILTLQNMKFFVEALPSSQFMRVHKSYIVSLDKIDYIEKNRAIIRGEYIPISASYSEAFKKRLKL